MEYRAHPSSYLRIATSFASAKEFFNRDVVSLIDEDHLEDFKERRFREHKIREVTLRHDLHALSKFFQFAIKRKWTRENPVKGVAIPSDKDAVRIQVVTAEEEKQYFRRAGKNLALYDLGRLMLNQGVGPDEALSLGKADVDLENGRIFIRDEGDNPSRDVFKSATRARAFSHELFGRHLERVGSFFCVGDHSQVRPFFSFKPSRTSP